MANTVDDLLETLNGPVSEQLRSREGKRLAKHGSYKFAPLDVRAEPKVGSLSDDEASENGAPDETTHLIPHDYDSLETEPTSSKEGTDSEGKKKPSILR